MPPTSPTVYTGPCTHSAALEDAAGGQSATCSGQARLQWTEHAWQTEAAGRRRAASSESSRKQSTNDANSLFATFPRVISRFDGQRAVRIGKTRVGGHPKKEASGCKILDDWSPHRTVRFPQQPAVVAARTRRRRPPGTRSHPLPERQGAHHHHQTHHHHTTTSARQRRRQRRRPRWTSRKPATSQDALSTASTRRPPPATTRTTR